MTSTYILLIAAALLVQTLLIIGLQRSRSRHKRAKAGLTRSQQELEQRVQERTTTLHTINKQLYDEIAKHEITEELLRETQDYLHSIINSMPSLLIGVTREGSITHWNSAAEQATGVHAQDALGQPLGQIYQKLPITLEELQGVIDEGQAREHKNIQFAEAKQAPFYDLSLYPLVSEEITGAVIRVDDVSLRVRMENAMIQNEKMMSLGEMAAGMAHEINNPIGYISSNLCVLKDSCACFLLQGGADEGGAAHADLG
mgnify:CR=1 FL=1